MRPIIMITNICVQQMNYLNRKLNWFNGQEKQLSEYIFDRDFVQFKDHRQYVTISCEHGKKKRKKKANGEKGNEIHLKTWAGME